MNRPALSDRFISGQLTSPNRIVMPAMVHRVSPPNAAVTPEGRGQRENRRQVRRAA